MSTIECASCGGDIQPGQVRKPIAGEGTKHGYCVLHDSLFDQYQFYITNPPQMGKSALSFWRNYDDGTEFPVIERSNMMLINCASPLYSYPGGIDPTDDFFTTVAYSVHDVMAFTGGLPTFRREDPRKRVEKSFERVMDTFYEDVKMPKHEQEVGEALVAQIIPQTFPYVIPELEPIRDFANECTEFHIPEVHPELQ